MVELIPHPFSRLVTRMLGELEGKGGIFDLPRSKFFRVASDDVDLSVSFQGKRVSTPLGPAAGPQSQLAQNLALSWLGGSRVFELKTVQVNDRLQIPRPCIDMRNVGFNVEWSQELRLEESLREYVKGRMLLEMLSNAPRTDATQPGGGAGWGDGAADLVFDMSVGYDLAGIRSDGVRRFLDGMRDASLWVEEYRCEIPTRFAWARDLEFPTKLSDTLTLSTFHGCPPDEIEAIVDHLQREHHLHCIVKLNPTLLGPDETRALLHDQLGYHALTVPDDAFENDTRWDDAVGFVERLDASASALGLLFGVKFSNTLIVEHDGTFLPSSEARKYLSGPPLHVLAIALVDRFRRRFGGTIPVSFSGGIDRVNFADAVALGLVPVTVCSDLLKPGGYGRQVTYLQELRRRMVEVGARTVDEFILRAYAPPDEVAAATIEASVVRNSAIYAAQVQQDRRYHEEENRKPPKKIGSRLELFNCVTCDKCIPVCPNDANFALELSKRTIPIRRLVPTSDGFEAVDAGEFVLDQRHQIGNFADFCNECGNCDIFCPEDGGPYVVKPRFFGSLSNWRASPHHDGFVVSRVGSVERVDARIDGREMRLEVEGERALFAGEGFELRFLRSDVIGTLSGTISKEVDFTWYYIVESIREAICDGDALSYVTP